LKAELNIHAYKRAITNPVCEYNFRAIFACSVQKSARAKLCISMPSHFRHRSYNSLQLLDFVPDELQLGVRPPRLLQCSRHSPQSAL
jgi:hypothetical protein